MRRGTLLKALGASLAAIGTLIGGVWAYAVIDGPDLDRRSLEVFGQEALAALGSFPELTPQPGTLEAFQCIDASGASKAMPDLGKLEKIADVSGSAIIEITIFPSRWLRARYNGVAIYERGSGDVSAHLTREAGKWHVDRLTLTVDGHCGNNPMDL